MPLTLNLPPAVTDIAARLDGAGFRCLVVGGALRDALIGRPGKDIDLATDATPAQMAQLFPSASGTTRFGTTLLPTNAGLIEVTTFRDEADYDDFRRPSQVRFVTDPVQDLARRDFTFNALGYDIAAKTLVDPFGGERDLRAGTLRAVGKASERFAEDALRILRALRFVSQLQVKIEPATASAIRASAPNLRHLSAERVGTELDKLLAGPQAAYALAEMERLSITPHCLPELSGRLVHTGKTLRALGATTQVLSWAALLHDLPPTQAAARTVALAQGTALASGVGELLRAAALAAPAAESLDDAARSRQLRGMSRAAMGLGLDLAAACQAAGGPVSPRALTAARQLLASGRPLRLAELAVNGDDLMTHTGLAPGPWLGEQLNRLLDGCAAGVLPNQRAALLAAAQGR